MEREPRKRAGTRAYQVRVIVRRPAGARAWHGEETCRCDKTQGPRLGDRGPRAGGAEEA